jgi:hypothetical protein
MNLFLTVTAFSLLPGVSIRPPEEKPRLPDGPAPFQALARVDRGLIVVRTKVRATSPIIGIHGSRWSGKVVGYEICSPTRTRSYKIKKVRIYDTEGRKVKPKALPKLLRKTTPVLVSTDGKKVDPLHLRLVREGTLILILPQPKPRPKPGNHVPPKKEKARAGGVESPDPIYPYPIDPV